MPKLKRPKVVVPKPTQAERQSHIQEITAEIALQRKPLTGEAEKERQEKLQALINEMTDEIGNLDLIRDKKLREVEKPKSLKELLPRKKSK